MALRDDGYDHNYRSYKSDRYTINGNDPLYGHPPRRAIREDPETRPWNISTLNVYGDRNPCRNQHLMKAVVENDPDPDKWLGPSVHPQYRGGIGMIVRIGGLPSPIFHWNEMVVRQEFLDCDILRNEFYKTAAVNNLRTERHPNGLPVGRSERCQLCTCNIGGFPTQAHQADECPFRQLTDLEQFHRFIAVNSPYLCVKCGRRSRKHLSTQCITTRCRICKKNHPDWMRRCKFTDDEFRVRLNTFRKDHYLKVRTLTERRACWYRLQTDWPDQRCVLYSTDRECEIAGAYRDVDRQFPPIPEDRYLRSSFPYLSVPEMDQPTRSPNFIVGDPSEYEKMERAIRQAGVANAAFRQRDYHDYMNTFYEYMQYPTVPGSRRPEPSDLCYYSEGVRIGDVVQVQHPRPFQQNPTRRRGNPPPAQARRPQVPAQNRGVPAQGQRPLQGRPNPPPTQPVAPSGPRPANQHPPAVQNKNNVAPTVPDAKVEQNAENKGETAEKVQEQAPKEAEEVHGQAPVEPEQADEDAASVVSDSSMTVHLTTRKAFSTLRYSLPKKPSDIFTEEEVKARVREYNVARLNNRDMVTMDVGYVSWVMYENVPQETVQSELNVRELALSHIQHPCRRHEGRLLPAQSAITYLAELPAPSEAACKKERIKTWQLILCNRMEEALDIFNDDEDLSDKTDEGKICGDQYLGTLIRIGKRVKNLEIMKLSLIDHPTDWAQLFGSTLKGIPSSEFIHKAFGHLQKWLNSVVEGDHDHQLDAITTEEDLWRCNTSKFTREASSANRKESHRLTEEEITARIRNYQESQEKPRTIQLITPRSPIELLVNASITCVDHIRSRIQLFLLTLTGTEGISTLEDSTLSAKDLETYFLFLRRIACHIKEIFDEGSKAMMIYGTLTDTINFVDAEAASGTILLVPTIRVFLSRPTVVWHHWTEAALPTFFDRCWELCSYTDESEEVKEDDE